jgi:hypothetical protein
MAILSLQNFNTMVQNFATSVQGACQYLIDFNPGSILLSVAEASSAAGLWIQYLILQVMLVTRLATSTGSDIDTWVGDFQLTRLPAVYATGTVTFSRFTATSQALILPGAQVKSGDGTQPFIVIADATQAAWNATLGGYVIAANTTSANATVQAQNPGTQGNVQAAAISLIASAIPFVDSVTNADAFTTGVNAETDSALQDRFANYVQTLSRATLAAIAYAISIVQQGLSWTIDENVNASLVYTPGNFVVTVDDGTGSPPSSLLTAVSLSISQYRPIGSTWTVQGPSVTTATISFSFTTNPTTNKTNSFGTYSSMVAAVQAAVVAYVNAIPDGSPLVYTRIAGVAYSVDPSIVTVEGVVLNGSDIDLTPTPFGAIKASTGSVSVS